MNAWLTQYWSAVWVLGVILLLALGAGIGAWAAYSLTAGHYRPIVAAQTKATTDSVSALASCRATSSMLEGQVGQQNLALADLCLAAEKRAKDVEPLLLQAANRLQQERTGGGRPDCSSGGHHRQGAGPMRWIIVGGS